MKKIFTLIIMSLVLCGNAIAASKFSPILDKVENTLFGFTYSTQDDNARLSRIEENVYGQPSKGDIAKRMAKLGKDMATDSIGKEITPKEDTFMEDSDKYVGEVPQNKTQGQTTGQAQPIQAVGPGVDYPTVNELEQQVFKKEFKEQDLSARLSSLEQKSFGKTFTNEDFSTRVDRLRAQIKPPSFMKNSIAQSSNNYYDDTPTMLDENYNLQQYDPSQYDYDSFNQRQNPMNARATKKVSLSAVENALFKHNYNGDDTQMRLSRIESAMFGTTFEADPQDSRMGRISSAYSAQKSSKRYDSNKFSQNVTTGVQIGMFILMLLACIL